MALPLPEDQFPYLAGKGDFEFHEDDGISPAYQEGEYRLTAFRLRLLGEGLEMARERQRCNDPAPAGAGQWTMAFHGASGASAILDGTKIQHRHTDDVLRVTVPNTPGEHTLRIN